MPLVNTNNNAFIGRSTHQHQYILFSSFEEILILESNRNLTYEIYGFIMKMRTLRRVVKNGYFTVSKIQFHALFVVVKMRASLLQMMMQRGRPLANDHLDGQFFCKWSSKWTDLLQMIIQRGRLLANVHPNGPTTCK